MRTRASHVRFLGAAVAVVALAACSSSSSGASNPAPTGKTNAAQAIAKDGTIKACMAADPPFSFVEGTEFKSFIPEMLGNFAKSAGVKIEYVPSTYSTIVASLQARKCDFIGADLHETPERAAVVNFTESIIPEGSGDVLFVRGDDSRFSKIEDLNKAKVTIAILSGSASEEDKKVLPNAKFRALQSVPTATLIAELTSKKVDAVATSSYLAPALVEKYGFKTLPDIATEPAGILPVPLAWAVRKEDGALVKQLNEFLAAEAANGNIATLKKKWLTLENSLKG